MAGIKRKLPSPGEISRTKSQHLETKRITAQFIRPLDSSADDDSFIEEFCRRFKEPLDSMNWLLSGSSMTVDEFFATVWEKQHLLIPEREENEPWDKIYSLSCLEKILSRKSRRKNGLYNRAVYLRVAKFSEGRYIETKDKYSGYGFHTSPSFEQVRSFLERGYSIQLPDSQEIQEPLHALIEPLESLFGSLVSANSYISPANGQIRGPGYDNEDYFILQTVGTHRWKLYESPAPLATHFYYNRAPRDPPGQPLAVLEMKPGSVLYLPRGTMCEAIAGGEGISSYIILSTYMKHHVGGFVSQTLPTVVHRLFTGKFPIRPSHPLGVLTPASPASKEAYAEALEQVAEAIRSSPAFRPEETQRALDSLFGKFMTLRLPRYGVKPNFSASVINLDSSVRVPYKSHVGYYLRKPTMYRADEEEEEGLLVQDEVCASAEAGIEGAEGGQVGSLDSEYELAVFCSTHNEIKLRGECLAPDIGDYMLCFRGFYKSLMDRLMQAEEPVAVRDLAEMLGPRGDAIMFVQALWNIGAVEVI